MKKWVSVLLVLLLLLVTLTGCGEDKKSDRDSDNENEGNGSAVLGEFDSETVLSQLEVDCYNCREFGAWGDHYAFLVIENASKENVSVEATVNFYNEAGELIDVKLGSVEGVYQGAKTIISVFSDEDECATVDYELSVKRDDAENCVVHELSYEIVSAKDKEIVKVTNNSDYNAREVTGYMLFFKEGVFLGFDMCYIESRVNKVNSGESASVEYETIDGYDSYEFVLQAKRSSY